LQDVRAANHFSACTVVFTENLNSVDTQSIEPFAVKKKEKRKMHRATAV
jgi:hypothetical protein